MTLKLNGTNSEAAPAYAGDDADTGLQCGTNELKLVTGGTARATVDSSGNLGIGTTSPSTLIHGEASTAELRLKSTGASNSALVSFIPGTQTNPFYVYVTPTKNLVFQDNSTERMRILSGGGLTFNGDTAAANALDDYEEGTFDAFATTAGSFTGEATRHSRYTKIGNMVYCDLRIQWTGTTGSSTLLFDLPFTQAGTTTDATGYTGIVFYQGTSVDSSAICTHVSKGANKVSFYHTDGGSFSSVSLNNVNGTYDWIVSFSYHAA